MATLFIITGPAGVGKSTVSKKIAEHSNKSASEYMLVLLKIRHSQQSSPI